MNAELFKMLLDDGIALYVVEGNRELLQRFRSDRYASTLLAFRDTLNCYISDLDKLDHIFSSYRERLDLVKIQHADVEYRIAKYIKEFLERELDS